VLVYPEHPFDPALCETVSQLPSGFIELAIRRRLSTQVICSLDEAMAVLKQAKGAGTAAAVAACLDGVASAPSL
jgi:hypothetical protein